MDKTEFSKKLDETIASVPTFTEDDVVVKIPYAGVPSPKYVTGNSRDWILQISPMDNNSYEAFFMFGYSENSEHSGLRIGISDTSLSCFQPYTKNDKKVLTNYFRIDKENNLLNISSELRDYSVYKQPYHSVPAQKILLITLLQT